MFEGFQNPGLAAAAGLAAVPLIIHLLNRQRYKPMEWAAMRFVLAAYRRTRRRVQLENLILLLLRMGAIALLAFAIARPYASKDGAFAPLTEHRRDMVLVVDASASTGYREEIETVFERLLARTQSVISDLDGSRGDRVHVILGATRGVSFGWQSPEKALAILSTVTDPYDEPLDMPVVLAEVVALATEEAAGTGQSTIEVRLLSDGQRSSFVSESGNLALTQELDALAELGVEVLVEDHGPAVPVPANLSVTLITPTEGEMVVGAPADIAVRIENRGTSPRPAERVALAVDGNKLPIQQVDVPASGSAEAIFSVQFDRPGPHSLVASLDGDRLAVDDSRATVVHAPDPVRVMVVNGAPSEDIEEDEVGFLMLALEPLIGGDGWKPALAPFSATEVTVDALTDPDLDLFDFDVIVLAGVGVLPESILPRLEERVAAGGSLVTTLGPRVADLDAINSRLFRADGTGLMPAELLRKVQVARRESYYRIADFEEEHPAFEFFTDDAWRRYLVEVPLYQFASVRPQEGARVLATLDDASRSPLLIERSFDQGRCFLYTSSFHPDWSDIVRSPRTLVPFVHEWMRYAGRRKSASRVITPGQPLSLEIDVYPRMSELIVPGGERKPLEGEPTELADGRWRLPSVPGDRTTKAGLYVVGLEGNRAEPFAVQLDPTEGDLTRITALEITALHPAMTSVERSTSDSGTAAASSTHGELWRWLAGLCLAFLVLESLWGAWIGQRRRIA